MNGFVFFVVGFLSGAIFMFLLSLLIFNYTKIEESKKVFDEFNKRNKSNNSDPIAVDPLPTGGNA